MDHAPALALLADTGDLGQRPEEQPPLVLQCQFLAQRRRTRAKAAMMSSDETMPTMASSSTISTRWM